MTTYTNIIQCVEKNIELGTNLERILKICLEEIDNA